MTDISAVMSDKDEADDAIDTFDELVRQRDELRAELEHWWEIQEQQRGELAELRADNERL